MSNTSALPARAFVETVADAACFGQIGILWRLMAAGIKTANSLCFLDEVVGGEAGGPVTHAHPAEEGFYVVDGRCAFYAGGKTIPGIERLIELRGESTNRRTVPPSDWTPPPMSASRQEELFAEIVMHPVAVPSPFH